MADETFASGLTISPLGLSCARLSVRSFVPLFIYMNGRVATEYHSVSRRLFEVTGGMILVFCLDATEWWLCVRPHCFGSLGYFDGRCHVRHPCAVYRCRQRAIGSLEGLLQFSLRTELPMAVLAGALILGETVTPLIVCGVCAILAAIALAQLDGHEKHGSTSKA